MDLQYVTRGRERDPTTMQWPVKKMQVILKSSRESGSSLLWLDPFFLCWISRWQDSMAGFRDEEGQTNARSSSKYPSCFPVSVTHTEFPATFELFEQSGLPYGAIITPFIGREDLPLSTNMTLADNAGEIARCERCTAYMNPFVNINSNATRWNCSLCYTKNELPRSVHSRYRQHINSNGTVKALEEQQCLLSDFPMPFREIDGVPTSCNGKTSVPVNQRPLIHVFLVQESMPSDALQSVAEAIEYTIAHCMHPDIQVVLLSCSNRIGLFDLATAAKQQSENSPSHTRTSPPYGTAPPAPNATAGNPVSVQYIHLSQNDGRSRTPLYGSSMQSLSLELKNSREAGIFGSSVAGDEASQEVAPMRTLDSLCSFRNAATSAGEAKGHIEEALGLLYDGWKCNIPDAQKASASSFIDPNFDSRQGSPSAGVNRPALQPISRSGQIDSIGSMPKTVFQSAAAPELALGPILDEISRWICSSPADRQSGAHDMESGSSGVDPVFGLHSDDLRAEIIAEEDEALRGPDSYFEEDEETGSSSGGGGGGGLFGLLADIGAGLISQTPINSNRGNDPHSASAPAQNFVADANGIGTTTSSYDQTLPPVDTCSGVVLHLFVSAAQDLPPGWHASSSGEQHSSKSSAEKYNRGLAAPSGVSVEWSEEIGNELAKKQMSVNLWAVTSFDTGDAGLHELSPLAQLTGGSINHIVLGAYPRDERSHLKERLRQSCAARALATRCVLKLRTSPSIQIIENSFSGHAVEDEEYPGIFRVSQCTDSASFGLQFEYKSQAAFNQADNRAIVLQMAFAYDTLIESDVYIDPSPLQIDDRYKPDTYMDSAVDVWSLTKDDEDINASMSVVAEHHNRALLHAKTSRYQHNKRFFDAEQAQQIDSRSKSRNKVRQNHPSTAGTDDIEVDDPNTELCFYDRRKRLVAVRRLRVFTCSLHCTNSPKQLMSCVDPCTISMLIVRQALIDELTFRRQLLLNPNVAEGTGDVAYASTRDAIADGVDCPGVEFLDGWASTLIACNAACMNSARQDPAGAVSTARAFPNVVRMMQLLYGARVLLIEARERAAILAENRGIAKVRSRVANRTAVGRVVTDDFVELSSLVLNLDVSTAQRILFPHIIPVHAALLCEPGSAERVKELEKCGNARVEWFLGSNDVPLRRDALVIDGSPAFLLDTGTSLVLYRSGIGAISCSGAVFTGDPEAFKKAPAAAEEESKDFAVSASPAPKELLHAPLASPEKVNRFSALNILGRLDQFAGRLAGETQELTPNVTPVKSPANYAQEESEASTEQPNSPQKSATNANPSNSNASENEMNNIVDSFARRLFRSPAWLPVDIHRRLYSSPIVPRFISAETGTSSSAYMTRHLLLDIPDAVINVSVGLKANSIENLGLSFSTFVDNGARSAEGEVPGLFNMTQS